jgi:hypothetical protein
MAYLQVLKHEFFSVIPVSALTMAMTNTITPNKIYHGAILALVAYSAPGTKKCSI